MAKDLNKPFEFCGKIIEPGQKIKFLYEFSRFYTRKKLTIPFHVFNGAKRGPKIFIFSTLHGDELNGIEILNRLHKHPALKEISGTIITLPVANPYGLMFQTRNIKNRDLNRSFPGDENGSLASRLTYFYTQEVIKKCEYGLDFHSGGKFLFNFPHVRIAAKSKESKKIAKEFGVPVLGTNVPDKSLRKLALAHHIPLIVYEGGESGRLNEECITIGLQGILNVLAYLKIIDDQWKNQASAYSVYFKKAKWIRAPASGLFTTNRELISTVSEKQVIAEISDPFGIEKTVDVISPLKGVVFAKTTAPMVNEGDPLFHVCMH